MALLILNAGSSSLKCSLLDQHDHHVWLQRTIDLSPSPRGGDTSVLGRGAPNEHAPVDRRAMFDAAVERIVAESRAIARTGPHNAATEGAAIDRAAIEGAAIEGAAIEGVAHRVVHGGTRFTQPVRITPQVRDALTDLIAIAPLHNPPSLDVIDAAMAALPELPHVAVFDTAFHATLSPEARTYPVPHDWTERWGLRRFGFHGLSHAYGARRAAEMIGRSPGVAPSIRVCCCTCSGRAGSPRRAWIMS